LGRRIGRPLILLCLGFACWYVEHRLSGLFRYHSLLTYVPWFFMGITAFFRRPVRSLPVWLYAPCLAFIVIADLVLNDFRRTHWAGWAEFGLGVGFCLILPMFREIEFGPVKRLFHTIAKYSYGIYLSHLPILWFGFEGMANRPV